MQEADDLQIRAGQRVLVTDAKTSPDWCAPLLSSRSASLPCTCSLPTRVAHAQVDGHGRRQERPLPRVVRQDAVALRPGLAWPAFAVFAFMDFALDIVFTYPLGNVQFMFPFRASRPKA